MTKQEFIDTYKLELCHYKDIKGLIKRMLPLGYPEDFVSEEELRQGYSSLIEGLKKEYESVKDDFGSMQKWLLNKNQELGDYKHPFIMVEVTGLTKDKIHKKMTLSFELSDEEEVVKSLWRKKKKAVINLFKKYGIIKFDDDKLVSQLTDDLKKEIWDMGFANISFYTEQTVESIKESGITPYASFPGFVSESGKVKYLFLHAFDKCDGPPSCEPCKNPEALQFAPIFVGLEGFKLYPENFKDCHWLSLWIDRDNWHRDEFNFIVEPVMIAHRRKNSA